MQSLKIQIVYCLYHYLARLDVISTWLLTTIYRQHRRKFQWTRKSLRHYGQDLKYYAVYWNTTYRLCLNGPDITFFGEYRKWKGYSIDWVAWWLTLMVVHLDWGRLGKGSNIAFSRNPGLLPLTYLMYATLFVLVVLESVSFTSTTKHEAKTPYTPKSTHHS